MSLTQKFWLLVLAIRFPKARISVKTSGRWWALTSWGLITADNARTLAELLDEIYGQPRQVVPPRGSDMRGGA